MPFVCFAANRDGDASTRVPQLHVSMSALLCGIYTMERCYTDLHKDCACMNNKFKMTMNRAEVVLFILPESSEKTLSQMYIRETEKET